MAQNVEVNQVKPLSALDMAQGMMHEREIAVAKMQFDTVLKGQEMFIRHLRDVYNAPEHSYALRSWTTGFEPIMAEVKAT